MLPRGVALRTNAAGRGSGPHCPQAGGPRPRARRFIFFKGTLGRAAREVGAPPGPARPRSRRFIFCKVTLAEVARELDVSPGTLCRWAREGLVPLPDNRWTPAAL